MVGGRVVGGGMLGGLVVTVGGLGGVVVAEGGLDEGGAGGRGELDGGLVTVGLGGRPPFAVPGRPGLSEEPPRSDCATGLALRPAGDGASPA